MDPEGRNGNGYSDKGEECAQSAKRNVDFANWPETIVWNRRHFFQKLNTVNGVRLAIFD
jgi:hypothetical protein